VILALLLYAAPARWGFAGVKDLQITEGFYGVAPVLVSTQMIHPLLTTSVPRQIRTCFIAYCITLTLSQLIQRTIHFDLEHTIDFCLIEELILLTVTLLSVLYFVKCIDTVFSYILYFIYAMDYMLMFQYCAIAFCQLF